MYVYVYAQVDDLIHDFSDMYNMYMSMYMFIHIYMQACMHTYILTCTHMYIHI